jgi:hypothetical protein
MGSPCTCQTPTFYCFHCRVVAKRSKPSAVPRCPECSKLMAHFGRGDVPSPKKRDKKAWDRLRRRYFFAALAHVARGTRGCVWVLDETEEVIGA